MTKFSVQQALTRARSHVKKAEYQLAAELYQQVLQKYPNNKRARTELRMLLQTQNPDLMNSIHPSQAEFDTLASLNRPGTYEALAEKAGDLVARYPLSFFLWNILGMAYAHLNDTDKALAGFRKAIELNSEDADALNNIGNILKKEGEYMAALAHYERAITIRPNYPEAITNKGIILKKQGKYAAAIDAFKQAISSKPNHVNAFNSMGSTFLLQGRHQEAIQASRSALAINPDLSESYVNIGDAFHNLGEQEKSIAAYMNAVRVDPDDASSAAMVIHLQKQVGQWDHAPDILKLCLRIDHIPKPVAPFSLLSIEDDPERQLLRSKNLIKVHYDQKPIPFGKRPSRSGRRIRLGYFGADFHDHATMHLMSGMLRCHDRTAFEVFSYSYGTPVPGKGRQLAEQNTEHFLDVYKLPDTELVDLARSHDLDIAIDLKGYTKHTRSRVFQYRLAPLQINYLGYPGSMGADFIDYIIADPHLIPEEQRVHYSEKVIYLPHSYQPNDNQREISEVETSKQDMGLPEDAFVFCCFNNNYKIGPREFDIWMRLLRKVEGSVLWLIRSNETAEKNLRNEAQKRGVDPVRVILAEKRPHAEHLARHGHADLFLDTFAYNAHTTASDALWSGLPLVTLAGEQFAARVGASLLTAAGLPELITSSEKAYEALILDLARDPEKLGSLRDRLARNRLSVPLFDTEQYTRDFEDGLRQAHALHLSGKDPQEIQVR